MTLHPRVQSPGPFIVLLWVALIAVGVRLRALGLLNPTLLLEQLSSDDLQYWMWGGELANSGNWIGTEPFFLGPLYPYALGVMRMTGATMHSVIVLQALLTVGVVVGLTSVALRVSTLRTALALGTLLAIAPSLLLHDLSILAESLLFALSAAFALIPANPKLRQRPVMLGVLLGIVIGLMTLARPAYVLLTIPGAALLSRTPIRTRRRGYVALMATTGMLILLPTVRHLALGYGPIGVTYSAGYNLAVGNGPRATGYFVPYPSQSGWELPETLRWEGGTAGDGRSELARRLGRRLTALESTLYFTRETWKWCLANPGRSVQVLGRKAWWIVQGHELPQVSSAGMLEVVVGPLAMPSVWFWVAFCGLSSACVICRSKQRDDLFCKYQLNTVGVHIIVMLSTFVIDRYKVQLVPALMLLAAGSVARDGFRLASPRRRVGAVTLCAALGAAAVMMPPAMDANQMAFGALTSLGDAQSARELWKEAVISYKLASERLDLVPKELRMTEAGLVGEASLDLAWARALRHLGRVAEAAQRAGSGAALIPGSAELRSAEIVLTALSESQSEAASCIAKIPSSLREQVRGHLVAELRSMEARARRVELIALMVVIADSWASDEQIVVGLTRALMVSGEWDEAERWIERGRGDGVDVDLCNAHRYAIALGRGRSGEASAWLERIAQGARRDARVQATMELAMWIKQHSAGKAAASE